MAPEFHGGEPPPETFILEVRRGFVIEILVENRPFNVWESVYKALKGLIRLLRALSLGAL